MSTGNQRPLWQIATSFSASVGAVGTATLGRITDKGLIPVALIDGPSGTFGNFYANDDNPIARDAASKELGTIGFLYGLNGADNNWQQLNSFVGSDDIDPTDILNALGAMSFLMSRDVASDALTFNMSDGNDADAVAAIAKGAQNINSYNYGWNGATWDRARVANTFKFVAATGSGNTTVWTPTAGKKVRVMGGVISIAGTLGATGVQVIKLTQGNGGTEIARFNATVQDTLTGDTQIPFTFNNGLLFAAINTTLVVNLGTAMASGSVIVNVFGTEE